MLSADSSLTIWGLLLLHVLGLVSACGARLSVGRHWDTALQTVFFALLASVAVCATAGAVVLTATWLPSATTLAVMILVTTWEPRGPGERVVV